MSNRAEIPRPLTAVLDIPAPPDAVWRVISDVRRTGEWSPECRSVTPLGPIRPGTLLLGRNRRNRTQWYTVSRLAEVNAGSGIGWTVLTNRSQWRYLLTPLPSTVSVPESTRVTHTRRTPRGEGHFALWFTRRFLGGQAAHDDELEAGMIAGMQRIAAIVAREAPSRQDTDARAGRRLRDLSSRSNRPCHHLNRGRR